MAQKRGRPISTDSADPQILRRRQLTAARTQLYRERQQTARTASAIQPTPDQLSHGEAVVDTAFTEQDAAETLTQLGLRVQGVTLAQDPIDTVTEKHSFAVNDHDRLYGTAHQPTDSVSFQTSLYRTVPIPIPIPIRLTETCFSPPDLQRVSQIPRPVSLTCPDISDHFPRATLSPRMLQLALPLALLTDHLSAR
jgi:hypothetical protein